MATTSWAQAPQAVPAEPTAPGAAPAAPARPVSGAPDRWQAPPTAPPRPAPGKAPPQLPSGVRLILEQPSPSPFSVVRYEVVRRGRATAAIQRRQIDGYGEPLHAMALLTGPEAKRLAEALAEARAAQLPDAPPPTTSLPGALTWRVELDLARGTHTFRVTAPEVQRDPRYARVTDAIRETVSKHTGPLPFRDVFFPQAERGWIDVQSVPVARLRVDGVDTGLETPVYGYEVPAGRHALRLVVSTPALDRTYSVTVERGGTTQIAVDLR